MKYETGFENRGDCMDEVEMVGCPVCAKWISVAVCMRGPSLSGEPCKYFLDFEELDRGGDKTPKHVLICGAPVALQTRTGFLPRAGAGLKPAPTEG